MEQRLRLGQLLVDASIISEEQLEEVLKLQKADGRKLGTLLVERGLINETQLTQILSQQLSVPWVSLYHVDFSRRLLSLVPRDVCEKFCLVPIYVRHVRGQGETLYVAMDDPTNEEALKNCSAWSGLPTRAMISSPSDIRNAIRVYYPGDTRRASVPPPAAEPEPVRKPPAADVPAPPPDVAAAPAAAAEPAAAKPEAPREEAEAATKEAAAAPAAPEQAKAEPSIPPPDEVASAWKPPASASSPQTVESPDVFKMDFDQPPPAAESGRPAEASASEPEATADQPAAEPATAAQPEAAAEPATAAQPEAAEPAAPVEAGPQALDTGTLQPPEKAASPAAEPANDEVTLEVGREIPLEEVLSEVRRARPAPTGGAARLMALTMLDGTTLALPMRRRKALRREGTEGEEATKERPSSETPPPPSSRPALRRTDLPANLTAAEVVAALRASSQGEDVSEILGRHADWQTMFAALLSLLIRKKIITGEDFVEQLRRL